MRDLIRASLERRSARTPLFSEQERLISIHKRGLRRLDLVDDDAVPAVLALRVLFDDLPDPAPQEQADLQVWESEGGHPISPDFGSLAC